MSTATQANLFKLDTSIFRGIDFLYNSQLHYGEFNSYMSSSEDMNENCRVFLGSSPYLTTFILYSIQFVQNLKVEEITQKGLDFLVKEMETPGIWRFFTTKKRLFYVGGKFVKGQGGIVPDLDDTSCSAYCLAQNRIPFGDNKKIILHNRNEEGLFYTWLMGDEWKKEEKGFTVPPKNDICCGVNANVLLYLGENKQTQSACQYINDVVLSNREESSSIYFPNKFTIYYLISRAYFNGASSLKQSKDTIVNKLLSLQKKDGTFGNSLCTALAVCTLLNCGYADSSLYQTVRSLIDSQTEDGSWQKYSFFISTASHYGSEELTTAICIEALERCRLMLAD